jgi:hypothetical protein
MYLSEYLSIIFCSCVWNVVPEYEMLYLSMKGCTWVWKVVPEYERLYLSMKCCTWVWNVVPELKCCTWVSRCFVCTCEMGITCILFPSMCKLYNWVWNSPPRWKTYGAKPTSLANFYPRTDKWVHWILREMQTRNQSYKIHKQLSQPLICM